MNTEETNKALPDEVLQMHAEVRRFTLDEKRWEPFIELLDREPVLKPRLAAFLQSSTVFTNQ